MRAAGVATTLGLNYKRSPKILLSLLLILFTAGSLLHSNRCTGLYSRIELFNNCDHAIKYECFDV
jgi:hypothetical protein